MIRTTASCLRRGRAPAKLMWVHNCNMWVYFDGNYWMLPLQQMFAHWHWLMVGRLWPTPVQHPFGVRARAKVHCYPYYFQHLSHSLLVPPRANISCLVWVQACEEVVPWSGGAKHRTVGVWQTHLVAWYVMSLHGTATAPALLAPTCLKRLADMCSPALACKAAKIPTFRSPSHQ